MECPKCHKIIHDNTTICPHCHKVLSLLCPNCHSQSKSSICEHCGYIILIKCAKCGKLVPTNTRRCKCGLEVKNSIACNECESDEFASLCINFGSLKAIRNVLASDDLYSKFLIKLKNLINAQLKGFEGTIIMYGTSYVINFNKELSFSSSVDKALRLSLKILNAFTGLNLRLQEELGCPLKISAVIQKKYAENLLANQMLENNVKPLMIKKNEKKFLRGMEIILDQYAQDCIGRDYKTDSLYSLELNNTTIMYYELLLDNYILPPSTSEDTPISIQQRELGKKSENVLTDMFSFKVFDIKAKCNFEQCTIAELASKFKPENKIITLKTDRKELQIKTADIIPPFLTYGYNPIYVSCNEDLCSKPWGFFEKVFKQYFGLPDTKGLIKPDSDCRQFNNIRDFIFGVPVKARSPEDARFAQMEMFVKFLNSLQRCVIIVDGFEYLDDTSLQTLELYFDKYKIVNINFVFITDSETSVHKKIKGLLRTPIYTEIKLLGNNIATFLSEIKEDATDFIQSFYYEKIKENYNGSKLYFDNAIQYLLDKDILVRLENKLIVRNNNSILIPAAFDKLIKARLKNLGKLQDASMILAYSVFLGERLDYKTLEVLGINKIAENAKFLEATGLVYTNNAAVYINNYSLISPIIRSSLKKDVLEMLAKNIIAKLGKHVDDTTMIKLMNTISMPKEEYLLLWKNSQNAIQSGDYDAYLKNCLGFLSILDKIKDNIEPADIENNKKDVFQNILMSLYNYSPAKIYSIENILLMDAINENDDAKITKLSNLMLQGALISANYTDALALLHNILERLEHPELIVDGVINTKFLLLSLVNIEIMFNIGDYENCISLGEKLLNVIKLNNINSIKPENFSVNLFVSHLLDTFNLVGFAKLLTMDNNLELFFDKVKNAFNDDLPEKRCILAIKDFLAGKKYVPSHTEEETPFSKIIYLLLQELSEEKKDYKIFALNIYQAKLLAEDLHQAQLEYICDMLIAYAYTKIGIVSKGMYIYNDILKLSEKSAIFNTTVLANYFIANAKIDCNENNDALTIINNTLDDIQKHGNQAKIFYAMFEKLYIETMQKCNQPFDIKTEIQKLNTIAEKGELARFLNTSDIKIPVAVTTEEKTDETVLQEEDDLAKFVSDSDNDDDFNTEPHE